MQKLNPLQCEKTLDVALNLAGKAIESKKLITNEMILANQMIMLEVLRILIKR